VSRVCLPRPAPPRHCGRSWVWGKGAGTSWQPWASWSGWGFPVRLALHGSELSSTPLRGCRRRILSGPGPRCQGSTPGTRAACTRSRSAPRSAQSGRAFEVLARRMDARAELRVTLLLNIQRKRGDTTAPDQLVRGFAHRFWKTHWPGSSRPRVFYDPRALDLVRPGGVLHAKAVVADDEAVFVTSANLTEAALERNIELGLLVRDRALAAAGSATSRFHRPGAALPLADRLRNRAYSGPNRLALDVAIPSLRGRRLMSTRASAAGRGCIKIQATSGPPAREQHAS
jgi:phosphatidylserine/phosphatidylglycerophosphate/cardiolipin synthase-like enzyme